MNRYDVLLAPTCAVRVPPANGPYSLLAEEELDVWINRLVDAARYTIPANETGLPAISVPAGLDSDGLPIGAQFYARTSVRIPKPATPSSVPSPLFCNGARYSKKVRGR
jgi:amidase